MYTILMGGVNGAADFTREDTEEHREERQLDEEEGTRPDGRAESARENLVPGFSVVPGSALVAC